MKTVGWKLRGRKGPATVQALMVMCAEIGDDYMLKKDRRFTRVVEMSFTDKGEEIELSTVLAWEEGYDGDTFVEWFFRADGINVKSSSDKSNWHKVSN